MLDKTERKTLKIDIFRTLSESFVIPMLESLILLVAIKYFDADDIQKSLLSSARFIGMFLSLLLVSFFSRYNIRKTFLLFFITLSASVFLLGGALSPAVWPYTASMFLYMLIMDTRYPFITAVYSENYRESRRGKLVSITFLLSSLMMLVINFAAGKALDSDAGSYRIIYSVFAAMLAVSALLFRKIPSTSYSAKIKLKESFSLLKKYPAFSYFLAVWFLFGLANLASFPLKVVYLAESERGLGLDPQIVILFTGILPVLCRLVSNYFWAVLFDRMNIVLMRMLLNLFIGTGIFLFFQTSNLYLIGLSVVITYIGFGGSPVVWPLWVTKIAPADKVQEFMALHTFLTGVRGIIAPFLGFLYIAFFPIKSIGTVAGLIFLLTIFLFIPVLKMKRPD